MRLARATRAKAVANILWSAVGARKVLADAGMARTGEAQATPLGGTEKHPLRPTEPLTRCTRKCPRANFQTELSPCAGKNQRTEKGPRLETPRATELQQSLPKSCKPAQKENKDIYEGRGLSEECLGRKKRTHNTSPLPNGAPSKGSKTQAGEARASSSRAHGLRNVEASRIDRMPCVLH